MMMKIIMFNLWRFKLKIQELTYSCKLGDEQNVLMS